MGFIGLAGFIGFRVLSIEFIGVVGWLGFRVQGSVSRPSDPASKP